MNREQRRAQARQLKKEFASPRRVKYEKRWAKIRDANGALLPGSPYYLAYRTFIEAIHAEKQEEKMIHRMLEGYRTLELLKGSPDSTLQPIITGLEVLASKLTSEQLTKVFEQAKAEGITV